MSPVKCRLSPVEMFYAYCEGALLSEIAERAGVSRERVRQILATCGVRDRYANRKTRTRERAERDAAERARKRAAKIAAQQEHGSHWRYSHGCRCETCVRDYKRARREYYKRNREKRLEYQRAYMAAKRSKGAA